MLVCDDGGLGPNATDNPSPDHLHAYAASLLQQFEVSSAGRSMPRLKGIETSIHLTL